MRVVRIHAPGNASKLVVDDVELRAPEHHEAQVRHTAIGVNFIDIYHRMGAYPLPLPAALGMEAVGVVEAVGSHVSHVQVGDRVGYVMRPPGAYSDRRNVPSSSLLKLPADLPDEIAASVLLKGLTAEFLLRRTFRVDAMQTIVVHAAAGGVGQLLLQWARAIGARVIGVVSTEEKAAIALRMGAHHVLVGNDKIALRVREIVDGRGVDVVYDSVGKDTFMQSLDMLRPRGMLILFGQASGPVPPFAPSELANRGSLYLTRPSLFDYIADTAEYRSAADALFDAIKRGVITPAVSQRFALDDVATAHEALESRKTTGSVVLVP
jgi:NADPH:quinone reductase